MDILIYIYGLIFFKHIEIDKNTNIKDTKKRSHIHIYNFIFYKQEFCLLYLHKNNYLMLMLKKVKYINQIYYIQSEMIYFFIYNVYDFHIIN